MIATQKQQKQKKIIINALSFDNHISCIIPKLINIKVPANICMDHMTILKIAKMRIIFSSEADAE